jgi:CelD/BcsL family acetyltransferase involved in cellulose biosynthesis
MRQKEALVSRPGVLRIASPDALRAAAPAWDDLWCRSSVALPTLRAELIAQWVEQFGPGTELCALVVEEGDQWVAALPLLGRRLAGVISAGSLPTNQWSSRGELLLDGDAEVDAAMDALVAALGELPWQLLWLDDVPLDAPHWKEFRRAVARAGVPMDCREQFRVGWIEINDDWQACQKRWSRRHRQEMARSARRLADRGAVRLGIQSQLAPEEVGPWLQRGLEIEDRSWKGQAGTSVLRTPGMFNFFRRQAEQLACWGELELCWLSVDEEPIAFAYGATAKGVFHSFKVGYDPRHGGCSPGQLLRYCMLERFHAEPGRRAIDCMGPLSDAHRRWRPVEYGVGRVVVAPGGLLGRMALSAYRHWPRHAAGLQDSEECSAGGAEPGPREAEHGQRVGLGPLEPRC